MKIWMSIRYLYEHKLLLLMTIFTEYVSSTLKCICFYIFSIFEIMIKHNRIPLGWLFGMPLWDGNDSFVRYAQIWSQFFYFSSLLLGECIGVTEHIEFQCHVKSLQKNYTLTVKCKVIEYEESYRLEKSSVNLMLLQKY